tara:strand:- start:99 stop:293 length:195 start_codon:yes stop_codon:yes gene_type:complete
MSKIGSYVLEVIEDEANTRYRNDYGTGSDMVLRNTKRGGAKAKVADQLDAIRTAPVWNLRRYRP